MTGAYILPTEADIRRAFDEFDAKHPPLDGPAADLLDELTRADMISRRRTAPILGSDYAPDPSYWSAPYPKKGMTETTMKPANEGDE